MTIAINRPKTTIRYNDCRVLLSYIALGKADIAKLRGGLEHLWQPLEKVATLADQGFTRIEIVDRISDEYGDDNSVVWWLLSLED